MIITCNECDSSFKIEDSLIKATGSKVRCSKCNSVFVAYPQAPEAEEQPETALAALEADADEQRLDLEEGLESAASDLSVADSLGDEEAPASKDRPADSAEELESDGLLGAAADDETVEAQAQTDLGDLELDDIEDLVGLDDDIKSALESEGELEDSALALEAEAEALLKAEATDLEMADSSEPGLADLGIEEEDISAAQKEPVPDSEDFEMNLDLETETVATDAADKSDSATETFDELDLSDLEAIIDADEASASQDAAAIASEDLDLDLDFQLDDGAETADADTASDGADELDFSDLEKMLESGQAPAAPAPADAVAEDLDLQFDAVDQPAGPAKAIASDEVTEDDDFLDIEKMLAEGEDATIAEEPKTAVEDQDLPLEMEAVLGKTPLAAEGDLELEFALDREPQEKAELGDSAKAADKRLESNLLATDDVDVIEEKELEEAELQAGIREAGATTDDFATDEFADVRNMTGQTDVLTAAEDVPPLAPFKKTRSRIPMFVVLLLIVLAAAIIVVPNNLGIKIPFVSDLKIPYLSDVKIPYLSDLLKTKAQDAAGNLKLIPLSPSIDGKFIDNPAVGQLFVISGKIKNEYDHPRSFVKVTGKLYQKGQKLVKSSTVFCGNVISDSELAQMDLAAINARLQNNSGDKSSNVKIKTGNEIAFMIVFDQLPENLDEYTVEVAGSSI